MSALGGCIFGPSDEEVEKEQIAQYEKEVTKIVHDFFAYLEDGDAQAALDTVTLGNYVHVTPETLTNEFYRTATHRPTNVQLNSVRGSTSPRRVTILGSYEVGEPSRSVSFSFEFERTFGDERWRLLDPGMVAGTDIPEVATVATYVSSLYINGVMLYDEPSESGAIRVNHLSLLPGTYVFDYEISSHTDPKAAPTPESLTINVTEPWY